MGEDGTVPEGVELITGTQGDNCFIFTFELKEELLGKTVSIVPVKSDGVCYVKKDVTLTFPDAFAVTYADT